MDFFTSPAVVFGIAVLGIYKLFELFVRKQERLLMIEKLADRIADQLSVDEAGVNVQQLMTQFRRKSWSFVALRLGLLLLGMGLGMLLAHFLCLESVHGYMDENQRFVVRNVVGYVYTGSVLCCGGVGLVLAFGVELLLNRMANRE